MLRLDYLSCFLTVLSTVLVARKHWSGLMVAGINSVIICLIGLRTSQLGFIPANLFCIGIYAFNFRSWMRAPAQAKPPATAGK
ncbi:MAG TPA: hypothetical protein VGS10_08740 [Terracidiphilus sp.]|nr:hypothetical protein [Terracidiphilus sp.]